jgi:hypothetical protein
MSTSGRVETDQSADPQPPAASADPLPLQTCPSNVEAVLRLQRLAGNAAVVRYLSAAGVPARAARNLAGAGQSARISRDPVATIPPDSAPAAAGPPARALSKDERQRFEREAGEHVTQAMPAFATACAHHREALKSKAKADAELMSLVIDIAAGFAAPVFATWIAGKMAAKVAARVGTADAEAVGNLTKILQNRDMTKAAFTSATKVGQQAIKANSYALFGETDHDAFLITAQNAFHKGGQAITDHLGDMTDVELVATWGAYAYEHTNVDVYRSAIGDLLGKYDKFVGGQAAKHFEIKDRGIATGDVVDTENRVYMADLYGRRRAILVYSSDAGYGKPWRRFSGYVAPEVEAAAKARTAKLFGSVETIDPSTIDGHIPPPPTP